MNSQIKVLCEGQWPVARHFVESGLDDRVVLDPKEAFLLDDGDAAKFYAACDEARRHAGLSVSDDQYCPHLEAEEDLRKAEAELIKEMSSVTGIDKSRAATMTWPQHRSLIDLMLRLLSPFVDPHKKFSIPRPDSTRLMPE